MKRLIITLCLLLLPYSLAAQTASGYVATGSTYPRELADRAGERLNVKDFGAKGDTNGWSDAIMAAGSTTLNSLKATFSPADVGKAIALSGSGANASVQTGTIISFNNSHNIGVSFTATLNTPSNGLEYVLVSTQGTGYKIGDYLSPVGGTGVQTPPVVTVAAIAVVGATVANGGSGGTNGACTITGTTGLGHWFTATGTVSGGALTGPLAITYAGTLTTDPTNVASEPVTTNCNLTGTTVVLGMGVLGVQLTNPGAVTAMPASPAATTTSGSGTGATLTLVSFAYGGVFTYGTDDSAAVAAVVNKVNSQALLGLRSTIYVPPGNYLLKSTPIPTFNGIGSGIIGEGQHVSNFVIDPTYAGTNGTGDIFSWRVSWMGNSYGSQTLWLGADGAGPLVHSIGITGFQYIAQQQNAFMFYERNDNIEIDNVDVRFLNGRCLAMGFPTPGGTDVVAYSRENRISLRCLGTGLPNVASVEVDSFYTTVGDSSNQTEWRNLQILFPRGTGLLIHNSSNPVKGTGAQRFFGLRVESFEGIGGDLIQFGNNPSDIDTPGVAGIKVYGLLTNGVNQGFSSLRITSKGNTSLGAGDISIDGGVYSGFGDGISIDGGERIDIQLHEIGAVGTKFWIGPIPHTGQNIRIDMQGRERFFPWLMDSSAIPNVSILPYGSVGSPQTGVANIKPMFNNNQITGTASIIAGGANNTVNNNGNTVSGGYNNSVVGQYSTISGGLMATDHGHIGANCYASGNINGVAGDAQQCEYVLRGTTSTTSPVVLTTTGTAPGANNTLNCINPSTLAVYSLLIDVIASDRNSLSNNEAWIGWAGKMHRPSSPNTTLVKMGTKPTPITDGTVTGSDISATHDQTNGCLALTFTPPTGNAVKWDVVARVKTVQVQ